MSSIQQQRREIVAAVRVCVRVGVVTEAEAARAIASLRNDAKAAAK